VASPLILYSTQSWLAYQISERFYGGRHWVWCSPFLGPSAVAPLDQTTRPSSSPLEIYRVLHDEVVRGDRQSTRVDQTRGGLRRGAASKRELGVIDDSELDKVGAIIDQAALNDFRPLLYVIPFSSVAGEALDVPISERAHVMSEEYRIESLRRASFDIIEFPNLRS
jgi:hypothetical protein